MTEKQLPRAVRANNPGNIRVGQKWQGLMPENLMTPEQKAEKAFAVFRTPAMGFRALAVTLLTYQKKYGIDTINKAILRWAPPNENNSFAYCAAVAKATGFQQTQVLDFSDFGVMRKLAKAIAVHECGGWFFSDLDLDLGVSQVCPP